MAWPSCLKEKEKKETVRKKTFIKRSWSHYFNTKVDSDDNVIRVTFKIETLHLSQTLVEARGRKWHDYLNYTHKGNNAGRGKSGEHIAVLYEELITALLPSPPFILVHKYGSSEFFFHIIYFNEK